MKALWNEPLWLNLSAEARSLLLVLLTHPACREGLCTLEDVILAPLAGLPVLQESDDDVTLEDALYELRGDGLVDEENVQVKDFPFWAELLG